MPFGMAESSDKKPDLKKQIRSLVSLAVFALIVALLFRSWDMARMIVAGLVAHELGHILALQQHGIPWDMRFTLAGAVTTSPLKQRRRLGHFANTMIHLAGPLFNLIYALLALLIAARFAGDNNTYWLRLANFSVLLGLLNLLPLGGLSDGGKFIRRLFASLSESQERKFLLGLALWLFSVVWIGLVTRMQPLHLWSVALIGSGLFLQVLYESTQDNPADATKPGAMNSRQVVYLLLYATLLVFASSIIAYFTPLWLTTKEAMIFMDSLLVPITLLSQLVSTPLGLGLLLVVLVLSVLVFIRRKLRS